MRACHPRTADGVAPSEDVFIDGVFALSALRCQRGMDVSIGTERSHADSTESSSLRESDMAREGRGARGRGRRRARW